MLFAVCGLHLRNGPLNYQLVDVGGKFIRDAMTSGDYKMYALVDASTPVKPGLILYPGGAPGSTKMPLELWDMPESALGGLLNYVPSPLGFGTVFLDNGEKVKGFICESWAGDVEKAALLGIVSTDITAYGGWRNFVEKRNSPEAP